MAEPQDTTAPDPTPAGENVSLYDSRLSDTRLAKALSHPIRVGIMVLLERETLSPSQLADRLDLPVQNVIHHVNGDDGFGWPQRDGLKWPHLALVMCWSDSA